MPLTYLVLLVLSVVSTGPRPQEARQPRKIDAHGDFVHPSAGVRFPEEMHGFVRTEVTQFDDEGHDLAANYRLKASSTPVWVTVYIYPVGSGTRDPREKFAGARAAVEERQGVTLTREEDLSLGDRRISGRCAAFLVRQPTPLGESIQHSSLILFRWNEWWVKWRITFSGSESGEPLPSVLRLVEALTPSEKLTAGSNVP